jgi:voltage-gated potassium channel Kch
MSGASQVGAGSSRAFGNAYLCRRYEILFYTLLLTMVAAPLVAALQLPGALLEFLLAANLLAAVMPISTGRRRRVLLPILALLMLARAATAWFGYPAFSALTLGLWALLAMFAAGAALRFALRAATVDAEHLYAALSAYLLAGIFFGIFYWVLERVGPGTFAATAEFSRMSAIYFSFVTLATLGYGDIVPRTDIARGLAIVEGVGGQLFLAVMVARLVSLYAREKAAG